MKLKNLLGAIAIIGAATGAVADDQSFTMGSVLGGGYQAGFAGIGDLLDGGSDVLTFNLPGTAAAGTYLVTLSVTGVNVDFNFLTSNLNGMTSAATNTLSLPGLVVDTGTFIGNTTPPFVLSLFGTTLPGGLFAPSYSGTITAALTAPVPEPESYAMFLAGLGIIGAIARRRATKA